jgi:hypothetical protein
VCRCKCLSALKVIILLAVVGAQFGCGTLSKGRGDATYSPGWERIGQAARNAALSPETWVPAVGALAFRAGHADQNVSENAAKDTTIFGSHDNAIRMSDYLVDAAGMAWIASALATPGGDGTEGRGSSISNRLIVEGGAGAVTLGTVDILKQTMHRTRPDGSDTESFPSGHSAGAAFFSTLASRNIETFSWSHGATTASQIGLGALTITTAWARVEANKHYPSDVLAGVALGHFFGSFVNDAFFGLDNPLHAMVFFESVHHGTVAMVQFNY